MRIDFERSSRLDEDERKLLDVLRRARAVAGAAVIGGIALIAVTAGPDGVDRELASVPATAAPAGPVDGSLMALERGHVG